MINGHALRDRLSMRNWRGLIRARHRSDISGPFDFYPKFYPFLAVVS